MDPLGVVKVIEKFANPVLHVGVVLMIAEMNLFVFECASDTRSGETFPSRNISSAL